MTLIQKQNNVFLVTIPKEVVKYLKIKKGEEVFLIPKDDGDILIKRKKE